MRTRLRLFLEWGITFEEEYRVEEQAARKVYYADQNALTRAIVRKYPPKLTEQKVPVLLRARVSATTRPCRRWWWRRTSTMTVCRTSAPLIIFPGRRWIGELL